jgi:hypothetical protein
MSLLTEIETPVLIVAAAWSVCPARSYWAITAFVRSFSSIMAVGGVSRRRRVLDTYVVEDPRVAAARNQTCGAPCRFGSDGFVAWREVGGSV